MILDKENTFFNKKALSASDLTSDIVQVGPGESGCPLHLVAAVTKDAGTGTLTTKLETLCHSPPTCRAATSATCA